MSDHRKCPGCGRIICQLSDKVHASREMVNKRTGITLHVCKGCHKEVWGK